MKSGYSPKLLNPLKRVASRPFDAEPQVVPRVDVDGLPRQQAADSGRHVVRDPHGVARQRSEFAEDGRFLDELDAERESYVPLLKSVVP